MLVADKNLADEHLKNVREFFNPESYENRRRVTKFGNFRPTEAVYTKYFVGNNFDNILRDFEDYVACARNGATVGMMRNKDQDKEEDIRASIIQEVSYHLR